MYFRQHHRHNIRSFRSNFFLFQIVPTVTIPKWKNFEEQNFLSDLKKLDWNILLSDCKQDVDLSYKKFLDKIPKLFDIHAPVTKISHKEKKVYLNLG